MQLSSWQNWLRTLIPSWRFFEKTGEVARLYCRIGADSDHLGSWQLHEPKISPINFLQKFFLNPTATQAHAEQNLLYHFLYELEQNSEYPEQLETYRLIQEMIERDLRLEAQSNHWYQFQIQSLDQKTSTESKLVTSATHRYDGQAGDE